MRLAEWAARRVERRAIASGGVSMAHIDFENAISFLTATVRVDPRRILPLMELADSALDDVRENVADEALPDDSPASEQRTAEPESTAQKMRMFVKTYVGLRAHIAKRYGGAVALQTFDEVAQLIESEHGPDVRRAGVTGSLLERQNPPSGVLDYHRLNWLSSRYLPWTVTNSRDAWANVLAFRTTNGQREQTHWREFLLQTPGMAGCEYDELAAVYDVLGLHAQRRMLLSVNAQRRLLRIALPWGFSRFKRRDGSLSREYMIVPVLTLLTRPRSALFRRSLTLTVFLLPDSRDAQGLPPLIAADLSGLCHQSVWIPARPALPALVGEDGGAMQAIRGPLEQYVSTFLPGPKRFLHEIFDAIVQRVIADLGSGEPPTRAELDDDETEARREERIAARVAVSRSRTAIFGTAAQFEGSRHPSVWTRLTEMRAEERGELIGRLLSVNAGRTGREWMVDGDALQLENLRVTNAFDEDTNALALYNPMSRFILNIMPKIPGLFVDTALNFGVAWLALLAGTVSTLEEIQRSYRYDIEDHRSRVIAELRARAAGKSDGYAASLNELHKATLAILDELDVVYSLELVGQAYKAAYARMLEMEGIPEERENLLRELDIVANLLRAEEAGQLNRRMLDSTRSIRRLSKRIANSTRSTKDLTTQIDHTTRNTDKLTAWVVIFAIVSSALATNGLVEAWGGPYWRSKFWTMLVVDAIVAVVVLAVFYVGGRLRAGPLTGVRSPRAGDAPPNTMQRPR